MTNLTQYIEQVREEWIHFYATIAGAPAPMRINAIADFWEAKIREREEVAYKRGRADQFAKDCAEDKEWEMEKHDHQKCMPNDCTYLEPL